MMNINAAVHEIHKGYDRKTCWVQTRSGVLPPLGKAVITTQKLRLTGSDIFYDIHAMVSNDSGLTWSPPLQQNAFAPRSDGDGAYFYVSDFWPQWHQSSSSLLGTGHTPRYKDDDLTPPDYRRSPAYSTFDPATEQWDDWRFLELPDLPLFFSCGSGSCQRLDLPDGDILLPIYGRIPSSGTDVFQGMYQVAVLRCRFDGKTLSYQGHGNFLSVAEPRGLFEPSLASKRGRYYMTLRNDVRGYLAASEDGLFFSDPVPWKFDDGKEIGNYNTQQHWLKLEDRLFLVYTRRGLGNDHVFRHRAPLVMAEFDEDKMCLIRDSEITVVPERGARLGNFGITPVNAQESWVVVSEWMQNKNGARNLVEIENYGANNTFFISKITLNT